MVSACPQRWIVFHSGTVNSNEFLARTPHFYRLQVESFAGAVRGKDTFPAAGLEDGLAAIKIAASHSAVHPKGRTSHGCRRHTELSDEDWDFREDL